MRYMAVAAFLILLISLVPAPKATDQSKPDVSTPVVFQGKGRIYFVPLDDDSIDPAEDLAAHLKAKLALGIEVLPAVLLDRSTIDPVRKQVIAEAVIDLMKRELDRYAADPEAILIGLTKKDMYISSYSWQFAFSWRQESRFAVVSSARMDPTFFRLAPNPETLATRLRKMVMKNIGLLYYNLPQSNDPCVVMYSPILGVEDLDRIGENFICDVLSV